MLFVARYPGFIMGVCVWGGGEGRFRHIPRHNGLQGGNMLKIVKNIGKSRLVNFNIIFCVPTSYFLKMVVCT